MRIFYDKGLKMKHAFLCAAVFSSPLFLAVPSLAQSASSPSSAALPAAAPPEAAGLGPSATGALPHAGPANLASADQAFVLKAAQGGIAEIQLAQLAQQRAESDAVKQFAQKMIDDHTTNNAQLVKLATAEGVSPPSETSVQQQKMSQHLETLSGAKFDHAYMRGQIHAHMMMLKLFQAEAGGGQDAQLKAFAAQTVPTIQEHLSMAQQLQKTGA